MISSDRKILQVRDITSLIKGSLESQFDGIWVEGEVSNLATPMSGHCYLTLKDSEAQIRAVVFRYVNQQVKFKLENGQKVLCQGKITVYSPRGEYQLVVTRLEPRGLGALQLAFEQLKKRLQSEGLFRAENKKPLPLFPRRIGVVTSPTGAAVRDILNVLKRRFANVSVLLVPVKVQGEGAANEIADGIRMLNRYGHVDVMIVGRGGGSLEDLWAFNEEIVARAIYESNIPVVSAVGHEIDFTISDFVADLRAPTPSAAAELVVTRKQDLEEKLGLLWDSLVLEARDRLEQLGKRLTHVRESYFFKQPRRVLEPHWQRLDIDRQNLNSLVSHHLKDAQHEFQQLVEKLSVLNPLGVFARGYSLTTMENGGIIRSGEGIGPGDKIITQLAKAKLYSVVERVEPITRKEVVL